MGTSNKMATQVIWFLVFRILISYISKYFKLEEGDVILTGTPEGVGPVVKGDTIEAGLGDLMTIKFKVEDWATRIMATLLVALVTYIFIKDRVRNYAITQIVLYYIGTLAHFESFTELSQK